MRSGERCGNPTRKEEYFAVELKEMMMSKNMALSRDTPTQSYFCFYSA
jgi:hypothetical protein